MLRLSMDPPPTTSARRLSGLGCQMVALGTRSRDEVKRQNLTPRQNPVEISLEVGGLENTTLLRGLIVVKRLSSNEGISNREIMYKKPQSISTKLIEFLR